MAVLFIPDEGRRVADSSAIGSFLATKGIIFQQWEASVALGADADQDTVLGAYAHLLTPYMAANGYHVADVINVRPETPNLEALAAKFLSEHTHTEDEVRFFVEGEGKFWFNLEDGSPVFCVLCQPGDLISVPANTKHWFDMGEKRTVKAIRIFIDQSGWVPHYTSSQIAEQYNQMGLGA